jgi:hypothetical protein
MHAGCGRHRCGRHVLGMLERSGRKVAAHREPVYRTGSNIPVRDPQARSSVLTVRPDDSIQRTNMPSPQPRPPIP